MQKLNSLILATALLSATAITSLAVDNLQIAVQSTNVVLTWPSIAGETYIVEYRRTLNPSDLWMVLSPDYPAATNAGFTTYTNTGVVQYPPVTGGGANGGGNIMPSEAMAKPANGSGAAAPLAIYPPGFDFSDYVISNPATGTWESGSAYSANHPTTVSRAQSGGGVQPMDDTGDDENTNQYTGFYRVLSVRLVSGLTNGATVSDYLNVVARPEAGARYLDLLVDGRSFPNQDLLTPPFTSTDSVTFEGVDTAGLSNGVHTLQIEAGWLIPSERNVGSGYEEAYSQPVTIYVTNELSYPNWEGDAGDGWASFHVQSRHPAVDWEIDVYNYYDYLYWYYGYTNTVYPIHVMTGSTTNGMIDVLWDLTDDNGNVRTNLDDDPAFFSFTYTSWSGDGGLSNDAVHANGFQPMDGGSGGSGQKPNPIVQADDWPSDGGYWVVAYEDNRRCFYDDGDVMQSMFNGWLDMASEVNPVFYQPPTSGTNAQTCPIRYNSYTNSAFVDTNSYYNLGIYYDEELFNQMLHDPRARNLYVYGHGGKDIMAGLEQAEVNLNLMHRYRFVWLDGCSTANGSWDRTFHINGPGVFPLSHYQTIHKRPAVFMGHTQDIPLAIPNHPTVNGIHYDGSVPEEIPFFRSQFVFYWWLEGYSLRNALNEAIVTTPDPNIRFNSGPLNGTYYHLGDYLQVEGYDQLGWDDYNDYGDIP